MEDSSLFMQWALSTLLHEHGHPPAPASGDAGVLHHFSSSSLPELGYSPSLMSSMVPEEPPAREGHRATGRCSSGDTDSGIASVTALERDGRSPSQISAMYAAPRSSSGGTTQPVSWNFSAASARPSSRESMRNSVTTDHDGGVPLMVQESPRPTRRTSERSAGSPSSAPCVQHHILAERKRREKINQRFIELSTVIPGLKKMDKATILSDATRYVKDLQEKLKAHQDSRSNSHHQNIESVTLAKKPRIAVPDVEDGGSPLSVASVPVSATTGLPEIEARISEGNVMVRIHCEDVKGSLLRLLVELEGLHLTIVHANAMPFSASTLIVNIMAKVEEGFINTTADDIVGRLCCALSQHNRNKKEGRTRSSC